MATPTATMIKQLHGWTGDARVYALSEPMGGDDGALHTHVVVSATVAMFSGPETYIFPSDSDGNISSWGELPGSTRGTLEHADALEGAGYAIAVEA